MAVMASAGAEPEPSQGAIFTRPEVVEFILDLVGYTQDKPLYQKRILEPSFGKGDFLIPVLSRLLATWKVSQSSIPVIEALGNSIRAVELHTATFQETKTVVLNLLLQAGIDEPSAITLMNRWLIQGDFLLEHLGQTFDFVVGNPPYVRQELIPAPLLSKYRKRFKTLYDRADLYIPFIEGSLLALSKGGSLGFICPDRWMKNRYGGPLRKLIADQFHLKFYVDMVETTAFQSEVTAYPAITIISREKPGVTRLAHRPVIERTVLRHLASELQTNHLSATSCQVRELVGIAHHAEPWLLTSSDQLALIRRIENQFPLLETTGCKVGIGVATGADQAFIGNFDQLEIEEDRKLPLVTTRDIQSGEVKWQGQGIVNPFTETGRLVNLCEYPKLSQYLEDRKEIIAARHCARKNPANWYRTIDRITPELARQPKLLIPDIKGNAHIVFERGELYPHHNLYFVTSTAWDLRALQAVLLSAVTRLFIATYTTKMRGGYLRFQAQYLRRLRIPHWNDVPGELRQELMRAAENLDLQACNRAVCRLYSLTNEEQSILGCDGE